MARKLVLIVDDEQFEFPLTNQDLLTGSAVSRWLSQKQHDMDAINHGKHVFGIDDILRQEKSLEDGSHSVVPINKNVPDKDASLSDSTSSGKSDDNQDYLNDENII